MYKQLSDGLILRSLSENIASDRERLPDFYASINADGDPEPVKEAVRHWVRDMMSGHPTMTLDDFFVVVDPAKDDMLVSATLLIPQTWRYEDILIPVGRPELVATHTDYRSRGLVRALFEAVHQRSEALGHNLQAITGIPNFYRQFGYTMAVELGQHAVYQLSALSNPAQDYKPTYSLRPATPDDIPALMSWRDDFSRQRLLTEALSPEVWHYEITGRHSDSVVKTEYQIIVDTAGQGVGFLILLPFRDQDYEIRCAGYVVGDQASYLGTFNDVTRAVQGWAQGKYGECPAMLAFGGGIHESLDRLIDRSSGGMIRKREYAWYLRVPDTIAFLKTIAPVLERRLAGSGAHRYTGELKIGFYNLKGISLKFEGGCLADISEIAGKDGYDVQFPWNLFLNVVFGYRTCDEIFTILPDVWANAKATVLMDALFPKKKSWLLGMS